MAPTRLLSRVHFAKALVNRGAAGSRQDAFARIIGDGCPGHVPFRVITPGEAVQWISEAGGVAILAHPGRSSNRSFRWEEAMLDLKQQGHRRDSKPTTENTVPRSSDISVIWRESSIWCHAGAATTTGPTNKDFPWASAEGVSMFRMKSWAPLEARLPGRGPVPNAEPYQT